MSASVAASGAMAQSLEDRIRTLEESMLMGAPGTGFDIVVSGFAHGGFVIQDADPTVRDDGTLADYAGTDVKMGDAEIIFEATSVLDNGIQVGGRVELEGFTTSDQIDDTYMWLQGGFGRFEIGAHDDAASTMRFSAPWLGLNGADGASYRYTATTAVRTGTGIDLSGDARKITYFTPRFSGFQFGISYTPDNADRNGSTNGGGARDTNNDAVENIVGVGGNFTRAFGDVAIGASAVWQSGSANATGDFVGRDGAAGVSDDPTNWHIGGEVSMQGFTVGGSYLRTEGFIGGGGNAVFTRELDVNSDVSSFVFDLSNRLEETAWVVGARYQTGPWGVGIGYFQAEGNGYPGGNVYDDMDSPTAVTGIASVEAETSVVGITAFYEAGPGVTVAADIGFYEDDDGLGGDYSTVEAVGGGILLGINF